MLNFLKFFRFPLSAESPNLTDFSVEPFITTSYRICQEKAVVDEEIRPDCKGRVRFRGSWWPARCDQKIIICSGEVVEVVGRCNITLVVQPMTIEQAQEL